LAVGLFASESEAFQIRLVREEDGDSFRCQVRDDEGRPLIDRTVSIRWLDPDPRHPHRFLELIAGAMPKREVIPTPPRKHLTKEARMARDAEILELLDEGHSGQEVAAMTGHSVNTVSRAKRGRR